MLLYSFKKKERKKRKSCRNVINCLDIVLEEIDMGTHRSSMDFIDMCMDLLHAYHRTIAS